MGGRVWGEIGKRRVRLLPQAQLRVIVDPGAKNGRLGDCVVDRQSACSVKWP